MWLFAVFFVPVVLVLYLLTHRGYRSAVILGLLLGALFCIFAIFFGSEYRMYPDALLQVAFHSFLYEIFFPLVVLIALVLFCWKGDLRLKVGALMPVSLGFFSLYIPFRIFFRSETLSGFVLFYKPILLFSCIAGVSCAVVLLMNQIRRGWRASFGVGGCAVISAVTPSVAEAYWYSGTPLALWCVSGALGICSTLFLVACSLKRQLSS